MQAIRASAARAAAVRPTPRVVKPQASLQKVAQVAGVAASSLALSLAAHADVDVKLGSDNGGLVFAPAEVTAKAGEPINFINNAGFPHNVVFDEDAVPAGVDAEAISYSELLNAPGEKFTVKLDKPGEYGIYCEPHQGAGMAGKITVQ